MKASDLDKMLPSVAKETLTNHFFKRLYNAKLDWMGHPVYKLIDAIREIKTQDGVYASTILDECFFAALKRYEKEYPLCWDNEKQKAYRNL